MSFKRSTSIFSITPLVAILVVSSGCKLYRAEKAFDEGKYVEAARAYSQIIQQNPSNVKAKMGYKRSAVLAAEYYLLNALEAERASETALANNAESERNRLLDLAEAEVRRALSFDPQNSVALDLLARVMARLDEIRLLNESLKTTNEDLMAMRNRMESEPTIKLALNNDAVLKDFKINNRPLREVFDTLSKQYGISFLAHSTFTTGSDSPITFNVTDMPLERILDTLALQNDLFYRYIDPKTVMIFRGSANANTRAELENQQYYTIYLDNAKPTEVVQTLQRFLGNAQQRVTIAQDNRLNALIVKGRPNDINLITRLSRQLDKAKAEVMVYLELLEVTESNMEQVGLLPVIQPGGDAIYKIGATIDMSGGFNMNRGGIRISKEDIRYLFPSIQLDALKTSGEAKMAARQNMRVSSDTTATFNFGEKIFAVTGTSTAQSNAQAAQYGFVGSALQNYAQQDVGVKVDITPRIHHNDEITLDIKAEVTNLKPSANLDRPDIGQRKLNTEVRAQNGETIIFGGLIREDETKSKQGIWGISDIPIIGKLLGNNTKNVTKTDVLLTVRTVIVRKPDLRPEDFRPYDPDFTALQEEYEAEQKMQRERRLLEARQKEDVVAQKANSVQPVPQPVASEQNQPPDQNTPTQIPPTQTDANQHADTKINTDQKDGRQPIASDLLFFLSPITGQITTGDRHQINMMVSGGKGVTSGELVFRIDPKLKVNGITAADFLTRESGSITVEPERDGLVTVKFKKNVAATDSGIMLSMDLEAVGKGNAPIMIESQQCFVGENHITAQTHNAMVEIE